MKAQATLEEADRFLAETRFCAPHPQPAPAALAEAA